MWLLSVMQRLLRDIMEGLLDTVVGGLAFLVGIGDHLSRHSGEKCGGTPIDLNAERVAIDEHARAPDDSVGEGFGSSLRSRRDHAGEDVGTEMLRSRRRRHPVAAGEQEAGKLRPRRRRPFASCRHDDQL